MEEKGFMQGPMEMETDGLLRLKGSIEHVIFANEENGFAICDLGTEDDDLVTVTGIMPYVGEGDTVTVYGKWVHNPKYGRQFRVTSCEKQLPADSAAILRYLSARSIKGIGPKLAKKIVDEFGEETFDVMENHPEWLAQISGITRKKANEIGQDFANKAGIRSAMLFFREHFGAAATVRIYKKWGAQSIDVAKKNPYLLCEEIDGIGFERADRLAEKLGLVRDSEERICSGISYLLTVMAQQNGHVCLPRTQAVGEAGKLLGIPVERVEATVTALLKREKLYEAVIDGEHFLYEGQQYRHERYVARKLTLLDKVCPVTDTANIGSFIAREEAESGVKYADLQRRAIYHAMENGVMILTGGPGTGKTTVVRALIRMFDSMGCRIALCAPTGRAAKRLSESTSSEAKTIHRLLEYGGDEKGGQCFHRDEQNLLEEDVIIADEVSMVDNLLMSALLRAVKPGARIILIGDADQLPSVGAGNILRDLLDSGCFVSVCLTEIFRQAQKSLIVTNAHAINRGEMPNLSVKNGDFFFLPREEDREIAQTVAELCRTRLPRAYGEMAVTGAQVIAPSRKGESGTEHLNRVLQAALNPPSAQKREYPFRDIVYREGDRVMQIRNNYDLTWERTNGVSGSGIFNGDIGVIEEILPHEHLFRIRFEDRYVNYETTLLEELEPAYAITVHKSQGSEYPIVILPMGNVPPMLRSRNLLYTAVTRAQMMVILVGRDSVCLAMVKNNRQAKRYTGLSHWLRGGMG